MVVNVASLNNMLGRTRYTSDDRSMNSGLELESEYIVIHRHIFARDIRRW